MITKGKTVKPFSITRIKTNETDKHFLNAMLHHGIRKTVGKEEVPCGAFMIPKEKRETKEKKRRKTESFI